MSTIWARARNSWSALRARWRLMRFSQLTRKRIAAPMNTTELMLASSSWMKVLNVKQHGSQQGDDADAQDHRRGAQRQVRLLDPGSARNRLLGNTQQFRHQPTQAGAGKALFDPELQRLDRLDNFLGIEPAVFGDSLMHA